MLSKTTFKTILGAAVGLALSAPGAMAQYPEKAIEMIVPFGAGGGYDRLARTVAEPLQAELGVPVVVKNMPGSGGRTGSVALYRSKGDGYTIGFFDFDSMLADEILFEKTPPVDYRAINFIQTVATARDVIYVPKDSEFNSLEDFKAAGRPIKISSTGVGASAWLAMTAVSAAMDFDVEFVHGYESVTEAALGTVRGDTDAGVAGYRQLQGMIDEIKGIAFLGSEESPNFPSVKTIAELGHPELANMGTDYAISAPPGTPAERIEVIRAALEKVTSSDAFKKWAVEAGYAPSTAGPEETRKGIANAEGFYKMIKPMLEAAK
ncbi:MAG TPA: tripartite tricarboxylate transporter substrate binding protein [Afifellaceae bacterium]|nr:tripartite tricarboxylate transporter substrate binding protein [Afifellaceae bacterium]